MKWGTKGTTLGAGRAALRWVPVVWWSLGWAAFVHAAPANDRFVDRLTITGDSGQTTGSTVQATKEPGEPSHAGNGGGRSVWWSWVPPRSGFATVYTLGSGFDTTLAVYRGSKLDSLQPVAANDDFDDFGVQVWSLVQFAVSEGMEYQIAVDGFNGASGEVTLTWHVGFSHQGPPRNDLFADRELLTGTAGQVIGTTRNAWREEGEPYHLDQEFGRSAWWSWEAPEDGFLTLDTRGSSFDTLLAVYEGDALESLALVGSNDDSGESVVTSYLVLTVHAGTAYQIAVDGYDGASGVVVLRWLWGRSCGPPAAPGSPSPEDGAAEVGLEVSLSWDSPTRRLLKVIYGEDDRLDLYEVHDPGLIRAANATAAVIPRILLDDNGDGTFSLPTESYGELYSLCPGERFFDQPVAADCSAALVAPDLVASAGHCFEGAADCGAFAIVFGFRMLDEKTPVVTVPAEDVYYCTEILVSRVFSEGTDWSLVRLDRQVEGPEPLRVRREGRIGDGENLVVIGHPVGLPVKVSGGAWVRDNSDPAFFVANLDTFVGNSGSPVLNGRTLTLEGILVRGEQDFVAMEDCFASKRCPDSDPEDICRGEDATRSTEFAHLIPSNIEPLGYEIWFGTCGDLELLGEADAPEWTISGLQKDTTYCWQVVTLGECGNSTSGVWSFTTVSDDGVRFSRGDTDASSDLSITDAALILSYLYQGGEAPRCQKSADSDDSGDISLTDAVLILLHLYSGGGPLAAPFPECGFDSSEDELTCTAFSGCP